MSIEWIHDEGQTLGTPRGKIAGIVDSRFDVNRIAEALDEAGFKEVEVLSGDEGVHLLERIHTFFFSDMEDRVLEWHIEALKEGEYIMLIKTPSDRVDEAADIATANGAHRLVHFGWLTNTWLTK